MNRIIFDFSYYCHYVIHSAFNEFQKDFDLPKDQYELYKIDFTRYDEYMEILRRKFNTICTILLKQHNIDDSVPIFAVDCPKVDIWRREIFPDYKIHRINKELKGLNKSPIFKEMYSSFLPILENQHKAIVVGHNKAEGDDVIAIIKTMIRKLEPESQIVIIGSDHDFYQILDENTKLYNMHGELLNEKMIGEQKDLLFKLLIGDDGDGVPACFDKVAGDKVLSRGFGKVACMKLVDDTLLLEEKFNEFPSAKIQFELNQKLIDFRNIPIEIKTEIARTFLTKFRACNCK